MKNDFDPAILRPGDCLLYSPGFSFIGWWIAIKTWTWVSHCEGYIGERLTIAARASGVRMYLLETKNLAYVLRPKPEHPFNYDAAMDWFFDKADGQGYDFFGLFCFYFAKAQSSKTKQFCSELLTRWYREGGLHPFSPWCDADDVSPAQFFQSDEFDMVWSAKGEERG